MSDPRWKRVDRCSRYLISDTGQLIREAYTEEGTGRYMKEVNVKPYRSGDKDEDVCVRLLTDQKKEIFRSLHLVIHNCFPDISIDECKQLAVMRYDATKKFNIPLQLEGEIWKDCVGYEDQLQVSNFGRLKRKSRIKIRRNDRPYTVTEKILKQATIGRNYRCVNIIDSNDKGNFEFVHRLVAQTFIPNPDNLPEVNHKDGDGSNNQVVNLEWSNHQDNAIHAWEAGLYKTPHPVICIETKELFDSIYSLASELGMPWPTVLNKISCESPIHDLHYQYVEKLRRNSK